MSGKLNSNE